MVLLGSVTAYAGAQLPPVPGQPVGPNVFPLVTGLLVAFCGVLIALGIGRSLEKDAEADFTAHGGVIEEEVPHSTLFKLRVLIPPTLLVFYVLVVEHLGFIITAGIVAFAVSKALGARLSLALGVALIAPIFVHLVFYKLLRVPLPAGLLTMPW